MISPPVKVMCLIKTQVLVDGTRVAPDIVIIVGKIKFLQKIFKILKILSVHHIFLDICLIFVKLENKVELSITK